MNISFPKPRRLVSRVRQLLQQGLWPYTPDPAPTGLLEIGTPPPRSPLIVEGNSRHALGRLRRALLPLGGRVLVVEAGGRDLYTACADGLLRRETVVAAVGEVNSTGEMPTSSLPAAVLPYPVSQKWNEEVLNTAGIAAGPANPEDLPTFLAGGQLLTEDMKLYRYPLRERIHLAFAHVALLLLVAVGPLFYVGTEAVGVGLGLALTAAMVSALLLTKLQMLVSRRSRWLLVAGCALLIGAVVAAVTLLVGQESTRIAGLSGAATIVGGWLGNLGVTGTRSSSAVEASTGNN